jgi:hypothetical protein
VTSVAAQPLAASLQAASAVLANWRPWIARGSRLFAAVNSLAVQVPGCQFMRL